MTNKLIRFEGLLVLIAGTYMYFASGYHWLAYALLLLAPDLSILGYAISKKAGARIYNAVHTITTPLLLLLAGFVFSIDVLLMLGFIWIAHIGMDRMAGYGLKYESDFKETHIQRI
ncbi:hypothetical protein A7K91_06510 [Paenibacillus oryzae]|uniref:DUF4260 domain-containing protein n=1 Tax=Paenibacillus oryzae TaxID=1844972 RepID=A0A1A5YDX3_9BACL|nr:DUF4260 domain-containing protein [Paenibacillus oryzae]OBR63595.1 hypothetical protein A7K91_06510 [Paenibacillus oryzae]